MQKTPLTPAMYHGANSFAKENYRETIPAGFGCNYPVYHNRGASKSGRSAHALLYPPGLRAAGVSKQLRRVSQLKRSNVRAIVHWNAPHELAQGAVSFPLDLAACSSRCTGGDSLQAPLIPRIPMLFRLRVLRDRRLHGAVHFVLVRSAFRRGYHCEPVCVCLSRRADVYFCSAFGGHRYVLSFPTPRSSDSRL